jgi:integrase
MGAKRMASRRGFPPNLYMNPTGYYYFVNPVNGKKKGIGSDKADAFSQARQANAALAAMAPSPLVDWVTGVTTYSLKDWVPEYKSLWIEKSNPAANTLRNHNKYLERIANAPFAWMPVKDITTAHVAKFLDEVTSESGEGTTTNLRSRIQDVFRMAITKGLIDAGANPVSETYKPINTTTRERMDIEQFKAMRSIAPAWMANAMNLALVTGQRREDIANMKFSDYIDGKLQVIQGKGQGRVRIKIAGTLRLEALGMSVDDVIRQCRDNVLSVYMVHHTRKHGPNLKGAGLSPNGLTEKFAELRKEAGIVPADGRTPPTFHELRSLCERSYRAERDIAFTQKLLGHSDIKTTSVYDDLRGSGWEEVG